MKYIIEMKKVIKRIVVIDASDDLDADNKVIDGQFEHEWNHLENQRTYGDWEYVSHKSVEADELISSADDIAKLYGCEDASGLERALFKYTNCGMCASWDSEKINLVGYVEGCDGEMPNETMYFPFTVNEFRAIRDRLEDEAEELWHKWNDEKESEG